MTRTHPFRFRLLISIIAAVLTLAVAMPSASAAEPPVMDRFTGHSGIGFQKCNDGLVTYDEDVLLGVNLSPFQKSVITTMLAPNLASVSNEAFGVTAFHFTGGDIFAMQAAVAASNARVRLQLNHVFFYSPFHRFNPYEAPSINPAAKLPSKIGLGAERVVVLDTGFPNDAPAPADYGLGKDSVVRVDRSATTAYHGPFIASQVAALAPGDITLQRILSEKGFVNPIGPDGEDIFDEVALLTTLNAIDMTDSVVNMSFGTYGCWQHDKPAALEHALETVHQAQGAIFVAAAGNDETKAPMYPAAFAATDPWVKSVGAHSGKPFPARACFSNFGVITTWAPGVDMVGEIPTPIGELPAVGSGTSFAAPVVTAALSAGYGEIAPRIGLRRFVRGANGPASPTTNTTCP